MDFCERCGGLIIMKEKGPACVACNFHPKKRLVIKSSEKIDKKEEIAVIKENQDEVHPIVDIKCPKCKNRKAFFWTLQTRSSDESETKFYKCTECANAWRV